MSINSGRRTSRRIEAVDELRGVALVGMVVFHIAWDCHAVGLSAVDPSVKPAWRVLGQVVATTFLFVSGFSLVLALRAGASPGRILRRLLWIAGAALLVSSVSLIASPENAIVFGILHCIVIANVIALAVRRSPIPVQICLAMASLAAPALLSGLLTGPVAIWLGLAATEPQTLDFRPLFPWLCPVLLGAVAADAGLGHALAKWRSGPAILRWLAAAGRHSLAIYLIHQPVAFGLVLGVAALFGTAPAPPHALSNPAEARNFIQECASACVQKGSEPDQCRSTCHCVLTALIADSHKVQSTRGAWMMKNQQEQARRATAACLANQSVTPSASPAAQKPGLPAPQSPTP